MARNFGNNEKVQKEKEWWMNLVFLEITIAYILCMCLIALAIYRDSYCKKWPEDIQC